MSLAANRSLELVDDFAVCRNGKPLQTQRRSRTIANELLALIVASGGLPDVNVKHSRLAFLLYGAVAVDLESRGSLAAEHCKLAESDRTLEAHF